MESDVIKSLKSKLAEMTYLLYVMGKELELIIQNSKNENTVAHLQKVVDSLRDSNSDVIKFYHEIRKQETGIKAELYNDEAYIKSLQQEVDKLSNAMDTLIEGNNNFTNIVIK